MMRSWLLALAVALAGCGVAIAGSGPTPKQFGFALQAAGSCSALQMRVDTENKVNSGRSLPIRDGDGYQDGLFYVMDHPDTACQEAWERFGCSGSEAKGLLQHSSKMGASRRLCEYQG